MAKQHRSKEEIEKFIAAFNTSGLSMSSWCKQNHIPTSTFGNWLNNRYKKTETPATTKFVEICEALPVTTLKISIGCASIMIDTSTDIDLVARLIKAVNLANV